MLRNFGEFTALKMAKNKTSFGLKNRNMRKTRMFYGFFKKITGFYLIPQTLHPTKPSICVGVNKICVSVH